MRKAETKNSSGTSKKMRPAFNPESRENQLVSLAVDLAERQLRDGTASSQVITHYLKLGSQREKLEREKIALENELTREKTEAVRSSQHIEELMEQAIDSMRRYSGNGEPDDY